MPCWQNMVLLIFGRSGASWRINFCKTYSRTVFGSYTNGQSSWWAISPHFPQKIWPSKHGKICKWTEIHPVRSPKFWIGPWDQRNSALFMVYFNTSFPTCDSGKNYETYQNFSEKRAIRLPGKRVNVTLIHPMVYKPQFFIEEALQCLVSKYQITYQNVLGKSCSDLL